MDQNDNRPLAQGTGNEGQPRSAITRMLAMGLSCALQWTACASQAGTPEHSAPLRSIAQPVVTLTLASRLAGYAQRHDDPLAWLMAARLLRSCPPRHQDGLTPNTGESWLDEAARGARHDPPLLALIDDTRRATTRGVVEGPAQQTGRLGPRQSRVFLYTFEGNADAAVAVTAADGSAPSTGPDLDLYVEDDQGAAVCTSEGPGMPELCRWTPRRTGSFKVKVENRLGTATGFSLLAR